MAKRPNPELVSYIEKHLSKGFKIRHIKRKLAEVGHPIEAIEDAVAFVTQQHPKKKPAAFMIVYGLVLLVAIVLFAWFILTKATQQLEYRETVKDIEERKTYLGMTDVELIKLAAAGDMKACDHIGGHNLQYACLDKYWEREDCSYERLVGESSKCWFEKAKESLDFSLCNKVGEDLRENCFEEVFTKINEKDSFEDCTGDDVCLNFIMNLSKPKDVSFCDYYSEDYEKERCMISIAKSQNRKEICTELSFDENKLDCFVEFTNSFDEAAATCEKQSGFLNFQFSEEEIDQTQLNQIDSATLTKLYCFQALTMPLVEKDIYTCEQLSDFVVSNQDISYLRHFSAFYEVTGTSVKASEDHSVYYRCLT